MSYVYLLRSNKKDTLKIGMTTNLDQRMKAFYTSSRHLGIEDEEFEFLHTVEVGNARKLESYLHNKFKDKRICGEWFDITKEEFINELESIDLNEFPKKTFVMPINENPICINNYISINKLFKDNTYNYNYNIKNRTDLNAWIEKTDHEYYDNNVYVNIEDIPFLCDGIWFMSKSYYQRKYFREFVLFPILNKLRSILTDSQIIDLFKCEDDEESITDIEIWKELIAHE